MGREEKGTREGGGLCSHVQPLRRTGGRKRKAVGRGKGTTLPVSARRADMGALLQASASMPALSLTSCVAQGWWVCASVSFSLK